MALATSSQGDTALTTLNVEQTLASDPTPGVYIAKVDLSQMASADAITLTLYDQVRTSGLSALRVQQQQSFSNAQTNPVVFVFNSVGTIAGVKLTAKQTAGTLRTLPYVLLRLV